MAFKIVYLFCLFLLLNYGSANVLTTELLTELEVYPCYKHESKQILHPGDSLGIFFVLAEDDRRICLSAKTDKNYFVDYKSNLVAHYDPTVRFRWTVLGNCDSEPCAKEYCFMQFYGYKSIYRLSPDFGYYKGCNEELSKYRNQIVESMRHGMPKDSHYSLSYRYDCPIERLPLEFYSSSMCHLKIDNWYLLQYNSLNSLEFFNKSFLYLRNQSYWIFSTYSHNQENFVSVTTRRYQCSLNILASLSASLLAYRNLPFDVQVEINLFQKTTQSVSKFVVVLNADKSWRELSHNFSAKIGVNQTFYIIDVCYTAVALVELDSANISAFLSRKNQLFCSANRIYCPPPPTPISMTGANLANFLLTFGLFLAVLLL